MKKFLFLVAIIVSISACSDSGDSSIGLPQSTVSVSKMTWEGVCVENNGTVNTVGGCFADGETIDPAEVCGFSGGILSNSECVYANAGTKPCGGRVQCVFDNSTGLGNCIYDNNTTAGCQFHDAFCPLNPDGTPICAKDPDNCTTKKPNSPRYRHGWQNEHNLMHGNMGGGNGNGQGGGNGNCNGNGQGGKR